ncbi:MAG: DUF2357 domain-containing protein [Candidatus Cloacimonetes bacterium]|jgi:predicted component of viral defense system (DUF524 family)|nr:DUF2357 domain-containing protein [Candidatus Cloacimonadota bacterium]MDD2423006.1 DUF2357 domain-containing protein [Candidatus Cloacimonadota bacterium]
MAQDQETYRFPLPNLGKAEIQIFPEQRGSLSLISSADAQEWGESEIQLIEGCSYEYSLDDYILDDAFGVVKKSSINPCQGRIQPKNYVGTISIRVLSQANHQVCGELKLEVRSIKLSYRDHYRQMLSDIADSCNELIMQANSPLVQNIEPLFSGDAKTLYQRFAFLKSVIDAEEFTQAVQKIISAPVTNWKNEETQKDSRSVRRFSRSQVRQLCSVGNSIMVPEAHPLHYVLERVPSKLNCMTKSSTVDTPENRFIKHALNTFLSICTEVSMKAKPHTRLRNEATQLAQAMEKYLNNPIFREIAQPRIIPLNSPILQRKEGYREVFRVWLMYDLASRITWDGGEDVYSGGKKNVAVLYEYWVYFRLLDMITQVFKVKSEDIQHLLSSSQDGLNLSLKQGKCVAVKGLYETPTRTLNVEFSYNRTFSGNQDYPKAGSWTNSFRPDYTLSVWPYGISQNIAEIEETIVHIHFDAKYRVKDVFDILGVDSNDGLALATAAKDQDLLKMHAYRDAIRRTAGAYVIYPGDTILNKRGFHEVIPGLGAFTLNPGFRDLDEEAIRSFMKDVAGHLLNRATQREKIALKTYEVYKDVKSKSVYAPMPVLTGVNRGMIPDEIYVLVVWYKDFYHKRWVEQSGYFNVRTGLKRGSLAITPQLAGTKYLLLHSTNELKSGNIYRLKDEGPKIWSKDDLIQRRYPHAPSADFYLVFSLAEKKVSQDFQNQSWDISKLGDYTGFRGSAFPFAVSMTDLMKVRVPQEGIPNHER